MVKDIFDLLDQAPTLIFLWPYGGNRFASVAWDLRSDQGLGAPRSRPYQLDIMETFQSDQINSDHPILPFYSAAYAWRAPDRFKQSLVLVPKDAVITPTRAAAIAQSLARATKLDPQSTDPHPYWIVYYEVDDNALKWVFHPPIMTSPEDVAFFNRIPKWNGTHTNGNSV